MKRICPNRLQLIRQYGRFKFTSTKNLIVNALNRITAQCGRHIQISCIAGIFGNGRSAIGNRISIVFIMCVCNFSLITVRVCIRSLTGNRIIHTANGDWHGYRQAIICCRTDRNRSSALGHTGNKTTCIYRSNTWICASIVHLGFRRICRCIRNSQITIFINCQSHFPICAGKAGNRHIFSALISEGKQIIIVRKILFYIQRIDGIFNRSKSIRGHGTIVFNCVVTVHHFIFAFENQTPSGFFVLRVQNLFHIIAPQKRRFFVKSNGSHKSFCVLCRCTVLKLSTQRIHTAAKRCFK